MHELPFARRMAARSTTEPVLGSIGCVPRRFWNQRNQSGEPEAGATDFDMVFAFKTLPMWWKAMGPAHQPMPFATRQYRRGSAPEPKRFNEYTGAPLNTPK